MSETIKIELLNNTYESEGLADFMRDWHEALNPKFNPLAEQMPPVDENGFNKGHYHITMVYIETPEDRE